LRDYPRASTATAAIATSTTREYRAADVHAE
jgi:hypothetical protein